MAWQGPENYVFEPHLSGAEWAWQFLRRNPDYRRDYAWFIVTWQALEADYGAPPTRDFFRWRQDPRAWRSEAELAGCGSEACPGVDDKVLIECWMGAKWGLRKFPLDPARERPVPGEELDWREQPLSVEVLGAADHDHLQQRHGKIGIGFDLSLPVDAQLEAAKRLMLIRRRGLERNGDLPPRSVQVGCEVWTRLLRLLDGVEAGLSLADLAATDEEWAAAQAMTAVGYRRILLLED